MSFADYVRSILTTSSIKIKIINSLLAHIIYQNILAKKSETCYISDKEKYKNIKNRN
jgi:hypothetical protein